MAPATAYQTERLPIRGDMMLPTRLSCPLRQMLSAAVDNAIGMLLCTEFNRSRLSELSGHLPPARGWMAASGGNKEITECRRRYIHTVSAVLTFRNVRTVWHRRRSAFLTPRTLAASACRS